MHCMAQEHSPRDLVQNRQGTRPDVGVQAGGTDRKRRGLGAHWKLASEGQNKQDVQSQGKHRHWKGRAGGWSRDPMGSLVPLGLLRDTPDSGSGVKGRWHGANSWDKTARDSALADSVWDDRVACTRTSSPLLGATWESGALTLKDSAVRTFSRDGISPPFPPRSCLNCPALPGTFCPFPWLLLTHF